jgi:transposase
MLVSIGQTKSMTDWSWTKRDTSWDRSALLIRKIGLAKLDEWLAQLLGQQSKEQMACMIETTHGLLIAFLLEHGWPVYPVNPRTVDRRRSASGAKTDQIDAYLLAKTGRADFADLHRLVPDSEQVAELKGLTRDQDSLIQMQTRLVNQLTACLKAYYPVALELFSKLQQRSALVFLQTYPTLEAARLASVEQICQVLKSAGHTSASKVAPTIFERLHRPSLQATAQRLASICLGKHPTRALGCCLL